MVTLNDIFDLTPDPAAFRIFRERLFLPPDYFP